MSGLGRCCLPGRLASLREKRRERHCSEALKNVPPGRFFRFHDIPQRTLDTILTGL
jgi:hypothetical protein